MGENINDNLNDNLNENLKEAQKRLIIQYTAELEGDLAKSWSKVSQEYHLGLEENYENLPYACFACGYLDGATKTQEKLIQILDFGLEESIKELGLDLD